VTLTPLQESGNAIIRLLIVISTGMLAMLPLYVVIVVVEPLRNFFGARVVWRAIPGDRGGSRDLAGAAEVRLQYTAIRALLWNIGPGLTAIDYQRHAAIRGVAFRRLLDRGHAFS
jgi:hypothetical protein